MKRRKLVIFWVTILMLCCVFSACKKSSDSENEVEYTNIESISVDPKILSADFVGFSSETFDISQITLYIKYKDTEDEYGNVVEGQTVTAQATWDMVKAEDKLVIKNIGTKTITLVYGKFEISFPLKIYDSIAEKHIVTFYAEDGKTLLGEVQRIPDGGRAIQPSVPAKENYTFLGWIDMDTNKSTTFDNIHKNLRLKAYYVLNTITVDYFYKDAEGKDVTIQTLTLPSGENGEDYYPEAPERDGYTFTGWSKHNNSTFYAQYRALTYSIQFVYRKYQKGTYNQEGDYLYNGKYSDSFTTLTVEYSADAKSIIAPTDYLPDAQSSKGISDANDYHFLYWYFLHGNDRIPVELPFGIENLYETTFYAYYVDMNIGSSDLRYKATTDDTCVVNEYVGDGGIVAIPENTQLNGRIYKVAGVADGVFKSSPVTEFVVSSTNQYFSVDEGVLYNKNATALFAFPSGSSKNTYTLKNSTEEISSYAFYNAQNLDSIVLNDELLHIKDYAFRNCVSLTSVTLSKNLMDIGEGAFRMDGPSKLATILFSGTDITLIGDEAFYGLNTLKELELPASLSSIGDGVFYGCSSLISVDATRNAYFTNYLGALYKADYSILYVYPAKYNRNTNPEIVIHSSCQTIERGAFYYANISCITLQSSVSLEMYSIVCPTLKSIRIDYKDYILDEGLFSEAFSEYMPETIYVKEGTQSFIGKQITGAEIIFYDSWNGLFNYYLGFIYEKTKVGETREGVAEYEVTITGYNGRGSYISIPAVIDSVSVVSIADDAFNGNTEMVSIEIPVGVTRIGNQAFMNCSSLTSVSISSTTTSFIVGDRAFYGCTKLTDFEVIEGISFSDFGKYVFDGTPIMDQDEEFIVIGGVLLAYTGSSRSVTVPSSIKYIATDAFKDKGFITEIRFSADSKLAIVDEYAFFNCSGIKQIVFPATTKKVKSNAFYGCDYLYYVYYNGSSALVDVSDEAYYQAGSFYGRSVVSSYSDIADKVLVYIIGNDVSGTRIESEHKGSVVVDPITPELTPTEMFYGWYYDSDLTQRVSFPLLIETEGDKEMNIYGKIVNSDYVSSGFRYEKDEDGNYSIILFEGADPHVIIGEKYMNGDVIAISDNAFGESVEEVTIPNELNASTSVYYSKITKIGIDAFKNTTWFKNIAGDFLIYDNLLLAYKGDSKTIVVPDDITILADGVFRNNKNVEYVYIPSSITVISAYAFSGCTSLKQVVLGRNVTRIEEKAFYGCCSLSDINFNDTKALSSIADDALDGTEWLSKFHEDCIIINGILYKYFGHESSFHIPGTVNTIGDSAFEGNSELVELHLSSSVVTIRSNAFKNCISLSAVYIPSDGSKLESIMDGAFSDCVNLGSFGFTSSQILTEIGDDAFRNSSSLKTFEIVPSLARIGSYAFAGSGIVSVKARDESSLLKLSEGVFYGCRSLKSVVFEGSSSLYEVGAYAFSGCNILEKFYNPGANIKTLKEYAFYDCRSLSDFQIKETQISEIGRNAVTGVNYIISQNTNLILLGNILVSYSGTDKVITVPSNITVIYDSAFEGNTNVIEVQFESTQNLKKINDRAFYGCSSLQTIDFPQSVETVGYQVMEGTAWLAAEMEKTDYITINNSLIKYNINYTRQAEIPEYVTKIVRGAFDGKSIYDIKIGPEIKEIEKGAFEGIIPAEWEEDGIRYQGWTMTIESTNLFEFGYTEFPEYCHAIYLPDQNTYDKYILDSVWMYQTQLLKVMEKYIITYEVVAGEADPIHEEEVHALYNAKEVNAYKTTIKQFVFVGWFKDPEYQTVLQYPFILTSDTTIYAKCIDYDEGSNPSSYLLEEVDGKDGYYTILKYGDLTDKNVVIITEQANKKIYSVTGHLGYIPYSGNEYQRYVYNEEDGLFEEYNQYGNYPEDTVTYRRNDNIEELSFANNCTIEVLGENCFAGMSNLQKVVIPSSVKRISAKAFADCGKLKEIIISGDVRDLRIEEGAFENCVSLQSIVIPEGVTELQDEAFVGCTNLKEIHLQAYTPIVLYGAMPFEIITGMRIYIPSGRTAAYSSSWENYYFYLVEEDE